VPETFFKESSYIDYLLEKLNNYAKHSRDEVERLITLSLAKLKKCWSSRKGPFSDFGPQHMTAHEMY